MFHLNKRLKPNIKKIAISHWTYELLRRTQAKNINTLPVKLEKLLKEDSYAENTQDQNYWPKKWDGQLLQNFDEVDKINDVLLGTSHALYRPLWMFDRKIKLQKAILYGCHTNSTFQFKQK